MPNLDESIEELCQIADGRNDILAEAAGVTAGPWYASPATHVGYELRLIVLAAIETSRSLWASASCSSHPDTSWGSSTRTTGKLLVAVEGQHVG